MFGPGLESIGATRYSGMELEAMAEVRLQRMNFDEFFKIAPGQLAIPLSMPACVRTPGQS
jgi:hypothetical protein